MNTIGILGGGQLARMLALAGAPLGVRFLIVDNAADACAGQVAPLLEADWRDFDALGGFRAAHRRRHLRFRERAGRYRALAGRTHAACFRIRARWQWRRIGSPRKPCSANSAWRRRRSRAVDSRDDLERALDQRSAIRPC